MLEGLGNFELLKLKVLIKLLYEMLIERWHFYLSFIYHCHAEQGKQNKIHKKTNKQFK